jgi:signal transduction histidine kinase
MPVAEASRKQAEQIIAISRLGLAATSLFAVWLDPSEAWGYTPAPYPLVFSYIAFSGVALAVPLMRRHGPWVVIATHAVDVLFATLQYVMLGPSSPLFVYFVFSIFSSALRWGWKGTLITSAVILTIFLVLTTAMAIFLNSTHIGWNRVIIRVAQLVMAAGMLVYVLRYGARLRSEIDRLARWPATIGISDELATGRIIAHACRILNAAGAVIIWESEEKAEIQIALWSNKGLQLTERPPSDLSPLLPEALAARPFLVMEEVRPDSTLTMNDSQGRLVERQGFPLHPAVMALVQGTGLASAPFHTERLSGRAFFVGMGVPGAELIPLAEVVAREIGTSLDQMRVTQQLQEIAAREERMRLARDLHDGVLQSLTGIRFELRALADSLLTREDAVRGRLIGIERALAIEQRELRLFIRGLKPPAPGHEESDSLAARLDALRERFALQWNTPVSIQVSPGSQECSSELAPMVSFMVHEAVVNALKHAHPTRVNVNVDSESDRLRIVVSDDGHGFPFKGRYDHRALVNARIAPRSLFDRVSALGGKMSIESSDVGSRIEMVVSI